MLQEFADCYKLKTGSTFNVKRRQIRYVITNILLRQGSVSCMCRCLAHIINLATQAIISTYSKAKYYSGDPGEDNLPDNLGSSVRDEIGIVRAVCVKVCQFPVFHLITLSNMRYVGTLLSSTKGSIQGHSIPSQNPTPSAPSRHEGAVEFHIPHAHSCRVAKRGM